MEHNSRRNNNTLFTPHNNLRYEHKKKHCYSKKNDLATVTETKPLETIEKPRLPHMVACKTVGEFKRNQDKIKKFCLEEKANKAREEEEKAKLARTKNPSS